MRDGVTPQEVQRAKNQMISGLRMGREKVMTRAEQQGRYVLSYGTPLDPMVLIDKINAVTAQGVQDLAHVIFDSPLLVSAIGPLSPLMSVDDMKKALRA